MVEFISLLAATSSLLLGQCALAVRAYEKMEFSNVGFSGTYFPVEGMSDIDSLKNCKCEIGPKHWFTGVNAPLADYVSVHLRGPLRLSQFAYYSSPSFVVGDSNSESWTRHAYYDAASQTGENVTFLTLAGEFSPCLGRALTYAASNGIDAADSSTLLEADNYISSDEMYSIWSTEPCPESGIDNGCGYYREGIPAYYGFGGVTKMFIFEFQMPPETLENSTSFGYYDLPAIWLLNDHIPRTSQFPNNVNCSCWASGCGEFDIFEAMNGTQKNHLYSTFHTFQGIENLQVGIQSYGYIPRDTVGTMRGGVVFDSDGNVVSFMTNMTSFEDIVDAETVNSWLSSIPQDETYSTVLDSISIASPTVSATTTASRRKSKSGGVSSFGQLNGIWFYIFTAVTGLLQYLIV